MAIALGCERCYDAAPFPPGLGIAEQQHNRAQPGTGLDVVQAHAGLDLRRAVCDLRACNVSYAPLLLIRRAIRRASSPRQARE